jgi:hypothetical protein
MSVRQGAPFIKEGTQSRLHVKKQKTNNYETQTPSTHTRYATEHQEKRFHIVPVLTENFSGSTSTRSAGVLTTVATNESAKGASYACISQLNMATMLGKSPINGYT